jgi:DNA-directed RNA polymerase subunit RPC12/RpoP
MSDSVSKQTELKRPCVNCGAELLYAPGTTTLHCQYCGFKQDIPKSELEPQELELKSYLQSMGGHAHSTELSMIKCKSCGANQHIEEKYKSLHCVYCGSALILQDMHKEEWILPGAIIPFQINQQDAHRTFHQWVRKLWWAPDKLKKASLDPEKTKGLYAPYWTFDAQLHANYSGQRGDYYYVSVPYTTSVNGKTVTRTRQERRTRWTPAAGNVQGFVDDTLVKASRGTAGKLPAAITRWRLDGLMPFDSRFLAGFITEKYSIPLKEGHLKAKDVAEKIADSWSRRDIGGDTQRIHSLDVRLSAETFKHILLPVYISAYQYKGRRYHFYVNGQTGVLHGERPYSFWKIFLFIVGILAIIALLVILFK